MTQNPIPSAPFAKTPSGTFTPNVSDAAGNVKTTNQGDTGLTTTGPLAVATQVSVGAGVVRSVENLTLSNLTTAAVAALTTSQIGALYDVAVPGVTAALTALTTTQIAALSTSQIAALVVPTAAEVSLGGGNGIPVKNGLVFVPGTASGGPLGTPIQTVNILHK